MKKIFLFLAVLGLYSCMDEWDASDTNMKKALVTSPTPLGETNYSIYELKTGDYASAFSTSNNFYQKVEEDLIFEGVVVANDITGNLYQTLLIRDIDASKADDDLAHDQCIQVGIRNTCLYPDFPLGQRVQINLKGLWVGVYSKVPKVGQPYKTSQGNWRLGPVVYSMLKSNFYLVGEPNPEAPELIPNVYDYTWLRSGENNGSQGSNRAALALRTPQLATVHGYFSAMMDGQDQVAEHGDDLSSTSGDDFSNTYEPLPKIFGPECLRDDGFGVDRTLQENATKKSGETTVTLRTGTSNVITFCRLPSDSRSYTGMLTYYSGWQLQLRSLDDISPALDSYLLGATDEPAAAGTQAE